MSQFIWILPNHDLISFICNIKSHNLKPVMFFPPTTVTFSQLRVVLFTLRWKQGLKDLCTLKHTDLNLAKSLQLTLICNEWEEFWVKNGNAQRAETFGGNRPHREHIVRHVIQRWPFTKHCLLFPRHWEKKKRKKRKGARETEPLHHHTYIQHLKLILRMLKSSSYTKNPLYSNTDAHFE